MWDHFPPPLRKAIVASLDEAGLAGRDEAVAADLLVAIASDPQSAAAYMFERAGIAPERLWRN